MSFQYPWALLLLIAIPILILIYILKNKYKEETEPSTYLWELSEKFLKRRNPLRRFEHLLSLIVQICTVTALAFALAHPTFVLPGQSDNIVFVLDGSASMSLKVKDGETETTRFDKAKQAILDKASSAAKGSTFSLIYAGDETRVVGTKLSSTDQLKVFLNTLEVSSCASDLDNSITEAQTLFSNGSANVCYLATDRNIPTENMTNVSLLTDANGNALGEATENYAVVSVSYSLGTSSDNKSMLYVTFSGISYNSNKDLHVVFKYTEDGTRKTVANTRYTLSCTKGIAASQTYDIDNSSNAYSNMSEFTAIIEDEDSLPEDNTYVIYDKTDNTLSEVLLVSSNPLYLKAAFNALNNRKIRTSKVTVVSPSNYKAQEGYQIYVFDNYSPTVLPSSGALWFFGSSETIEGTGFKADRVVSGDDITGKFANNNNDALYNELTTSCNVDDTINISSYVRYSLQGDFTTILKDSDETRNAPLIFAGKNSNNQRELVFAFDLHNSDLPLKYNLLSLVSNFMNYSNPSLTDTFNYVVGDQLPLSVSDNIKTLTCLTPNGKTEYVDYNSNGLATYQLTEAGSYEFTVTNNDENKTTKTVKIFAQFPLSESDTSYTADTKKYALVMTDNTVKADGLFDNILPIIIVGAVLFIVDWGLFVHEQY